MKLILLAGQSNMAGRGVVTPEDRLEIPGLMYMAKDRIWHPAIDPIAKGRRCIERVHAAEAENPFPDPWDNLLQTENEVVRGVGPGRTFGRLLLEENPGETVGLLPAAVGGTPIRSWKPGGIDLWDENNFPYDNAVALVKEAMNQGRLAAILWHQGETDSKENNLNYKADLREVIGNFRRDLNAPDVPFILGKLGTFLYGRPCGTLSEMYNGIMEELAEEIPNVGVADSAGLTHGGDYLHFDTESAHEFGRRYFLEYKRIQEKKKNGS